MDYHTVSSFGENKIKKTCFVLLRSCMDYHTRARSENKNTRGLAFLFPHFAPVAQLVEQLPFKEKVAGS